VKRTRIAVLSATALAAVSAGLFPAVTAGAQAGDQGRPQARAQAGYEPVLDPADFVPVVNNPYFPLPRGRTWVYRGVKDGVTQVDRVHVTGRTRVIEGITATTVTDVSTHRGRVLERTTDWYAQDKRGTVWYLGEDTAAFPGHGKVDRSGSWLAGRDDAEPGIIMTAHPRVPQAYRQEYLKGEAEDTAWTVMRGGTLASRAGTFRHILVSLEFTRLEPVVIDQKIYAPGIGIVLERAVHGPAEIARLVRVTG
jgi:hypothetical protein